MDGFRPDPIHPKGGRDGGRDLVFYRDLALWIAACYFPSSPKSFPTVERKFRADRDAARKHEPAGFVFVTNQDLKRSDVEALTRAAGIPTEIYHLERVRQLLDDPRGYGIRLEFLEIEMSVEEQLSFFAAIERHPADIATALFSGIKPSVQRATVLLTEEETVCSIATVDMLATVVHWSPCDAVAVSVATPNSLRVRRNGLARHGAPILVEIQVVEYGFR